MPILQSIQVGAIQSYPQADGEPWKTAYYKSPVAGAVHLGTLTLDGDDQQHKKVHGGVHRASLGYSAEHYALWREELGMELPYGAFAENFTISGLDEDSVCLGDIYQIGETVRVQVSQPRRPCNQINQRWGRPDLQKRVGESLRTGWYMRTLQEGLVKAGMSLRLLERPYPQWTIRVVHGIYDGMKRDPHSAHTLAQCEALEPSWREKLAKA